MLVLICNVGSTSLKYKLFNMPSDEILAEGRMERVGKNDAIFSYSNHRNGYNKRIDAIHIPDYESGIRLFLEYLLGEESGYLKKMEELDAVGFKTVLAKGFPGTHELTEEVLLAMEAYNTVAPAHNPPYIRAIRIFKEMLPDTLMVGCFETAFHRTIPLHRRLYALPYEWYENYGIQKYGYHGASHGYIARQITKRYGEKYKLISCHMGGSGSICAIEDGKSVDTSFGFSLQTGIPHSNRCGDLDAYTVFYLMSEGMDPAEIERGIGKEGGILGISGVSNDLRDVQAAAEEGNGRAKLAIDLYCEAIVKYIGAYHAILGGLDYLVFTAGIGENAAFVREKICGQLQHLGIVFDVAANEGARGEAEISAPGSQVRVLVLPTNEEVGIATEIYENFRAPTETRNRWKDGIMGVVVGDALGCPVQFESREEVARHPVTGMRGYGTFHLPEGSWTDDSSLTLALLESLNRRREVNLDDIMRNFVKWLDDGEFTPYGQAYDIGHGTMNAIVAYKREHDPAGCGSDSERNNGNGSLMRILPACLFCYEKRTAGEMTDAEAIETIHKIGSLTHAHLRANIACGLYYFLAEQILDGEGSLKERLARGAGKGFAFYESLLTDKEELAFYDRLRDIESFACVGSAKIRGTGYVVDALEAAVWSLLQEDTFEKALLTAVNLGEDTDTVAAIAGGLAGLYYGYEAIPDAWLAAIKRRDWIEGLTQR